MFKNSSIFLSRANTDLKVTVLHKLAKWITSTTAYILCTYGPTMVNWPINWATKTAPIYEQYGCTCVLHLDLDVTT